MFPRQGIRLRILSLFNRSSLKVSWTFTPEGAIWRLYPAKSGEIVGEARDPDSKRVSFFAIDGDTGLVIWKNLQFDEPWWIGIEDVSAGVLLVHKFASPDMPPHQGIVAIDLKTGEELWSNAELTYWFAFDNSIIAHKTMFEKRIAFELDIRTGHIVKEIGENDEPLLFQQRSDAVRANQNGLEFPEVGELDRLDPSVSDVMKKELAAGSLHGSIEYVVTDNFLVMNYHVPSRDAEDEMPSLDNQLKIIDATNGRVLYTDTIAHRSPVTAPDSFFIRNRYVYYIRDQKTLVAVRLPH